MESGDERVSAVACTAVLDRAFGKPQTTPPEKEDSLATRLAQMTPEERGAFAVNLAMQARQRLIDAGMNIDHWPEPAPDDQPQAEPEERGVAG